MYEILAHGRPVKRFEVNEDILFEPPTEKLLAIRAWVKGEVLRYFAGDDTYTIIYQENGITRCSRIRADRVKEIVNLERKKADRPRHRKHY